MQPKSATTRSEGEFAWHLGAGAAAVSAAREAFDAWLESSIVTDEERDDLTVVFSELASNAAEGTSDGSAEIRAWLHDGEVALEVVNRVSGEHTDVQRWDLDDPLRGGGRGLLIVRAYTDSMQIQSTSDSVVVRCARRLTGR